MKLVGRVESVHHWFFSKRGKHPRLRAMDDGVLQRKRDAEVGAIFGIGFAPNTGGPLSYLDRRGLKTSVETLKHLAAAHGARFTPPDLLVKMAEKGETFFEPV